MTLKAQVTLDLPNATSQERSQFYDHLKKCMWNKVEDVTTAWKLSFKDNATPEAVLSTIESELKEARDISDAEYRALVSIGDEPVKLSG